MVAGAKAWRRPARSVLNLMVAMACTFTGPGAAAFTASKVWYEVLPTRVIRVHVGYTIPDLKEFRESYAEFYNKKEADAFYWDLLRGADFFPGDTAQRRFVQQPLQPDPW